ncbi:MAG: shikimate kinase [Pseudomonadota bacterium]
MNTIFFVGYRACGKTTVATALAKVGGWAAIDTDVMVVETAQKEIAEIVEQHGWDYFRDREHEALLVLSGMRTIFDDHAQECAKRNEEDTTDPRFAKLIIATGGGIILREENRSILKKLSLEKQALTVFLDLPVDEIVRRLNANPLHGQRPSLTGTTLTEEVQSVLAERMPLYKDVADVILDARRPVEDLVQEILGMVGK